MMPVGGAPPFPRLWYGLFLLLVVALPLFERVKNIAVVVLLLMMIAGDWRTRLAAAWREPFACGLLVYVLAALAATLVSSEPVVSTKGLLDIIRLAAMYFIAIYVLTTRAQVRGALWALWLALVIGAVAAVPGLMAGRYHYLEIFSLGQFNHTAIYLAMAIMPLLALVMLHRQQRRPAGWLAGGLLLLLVAALVLTVSRAAWCAVLLVAVWLAARQPRNRWWVVGGVLFLLLAGAGLVAALDEGPWHALKNKFRTTQSLHMRFGIWKNALRAFADRPVLGTGPERFKSIFAGGFNSRSEVHAPHGHSVYVQAAVTTGGLGLAALLFLLATAVHTWWRSREMRPRDTWGRALWHGAGAGIFVVAGVGLVNTTLHHEHGMLFCLLMGMLVAWRRAASGAQLVLLSSDARTGGIARVAKELSQAFAAEGMMAELRSPASPPASRFARMQFGLHTLAMLAQTMPGGVLALQWRPEGGVARLARHWLGIPYLVYLHGKEAVPESARERRQLRAVLRAAAAGVAVSRATAVAVRAAAGAKVRLEVVPNGTTVAAWSPSPAAGGRENVVLACGRLVPRKGFDVLLRAMGGLRDAGWRPVIIGDGPQRGELEELARALGLNPATVFAGAVDDAALWQWYQRAGVFVMPSLNSPGAFEGLGIALLEAAAAGLPLVGTDAGGIPEIIRDGENGCLVPPGDAPALAAALRGLMDDAALRARLGMAAQRMASDFDWRGNARRLAGWLAVTAAGRTA